MNMRLQRERLARTGLAAFVAAIAAVVTVSGYHPCEGIGPLLILTPITAAITLAAGLPGLRPRLMLAPGAAAVVVIAVAIGFDYSGSGTSTSGIELCEPVPGFAGFMLAAFISGVLAGIGLAGALLVAWLGQAAAKHRQSRPPVPPAAPDTSVNQA